MSHLKDMVLAMTFATVTSKAERNDVLADRTQPPRIYSTNERSEAFERQALDLAARGESEEEQSIEILRKTAGRHTRDLRRAARSLSGGETLKGALAQRMLDAAAHSDSSLVPSISAAERAHYAALDALAQMPDADALSFLEARESQLVNLKAEFRAYAENGTTTVGGEPLYWHLTACVSSFLGPESSATDSLLKTNLACQTAIATMKTELAIEVPLVETLPEFDSLIRDE